MTVQLQYDELPPVELDVSPTKLGSTSPAPGRPNQERGDQKRGRESTGSSSGQNSSKCPRKEAENGDTNTDQNEEFSDAVEKAVLVSESQNNHENETNSHEPEKLDLGIFTSVTGTPNKPKQVNNSVNSPIISRKKSTTI